MRIAWLTWVVGMSVLWAACGADTSDIPCHSDDNCPTGWTCVSSRCRQAPADSGRVDAAVMCMPPMSTCPGGLCVNLKNDPAHCGNCGTVCPTNGSCQNGGCQCPLGDRICTATNTCANLLMDPNNCGMCGNQCGPGSTCNNGFCGMPVCTGTQIMCGLTCVDPLTDPRNCGGCSQPCAPSQVCTDGICNYPPPTCPLETSDCKGVCTDVTLDANHCGDCNTRCNSSEICSQSACSTFQCSANTCDQNGRSDCTSNMYNAADCGACGVLCGSGQTCIMGVCYNYLAVTDCGSCVNDYAQCCQTADPNAPTVCVMGTSNCPP
jgi:hypothetical protein